MSTTVGAQTSLRKIGEMELSLVGLTATPDSLNPAVPKDVATAIKIDVKGGSTLLSASDVTKFLGPNFELRGDLAGPGLATPVELTQPTPGSSLLLPLPALNTPGTYTISNLRFVSGDRTLMDVTPSHVDLNVLTQILITSVVTRPLTLQEIKDKGIVLEKDDVIGFDFTLALKLESTPIQVTFPVVFDRQGVPVPTGLIPPTLLEREGVDVPTIVPMMLDVEDGDILSPRPMLKLPDGRTVEVKIPALLVIPGNVGYLKQFFSAQLYVQNGAPLGTNLVVHDVTGTILLPPGDDGVLNTADDPLSLPDLKTGPQSLTKAVKAVGPDGAPDTADDIDHLGPGESGQVEFLLRGDQEGYHPIEFNIAAVLEGLPTGPVNVHGHGSGGVLVRNPFFDVTFTAPSVVRAGERFTLNMTLTNIGGGPANALTVALDASRMSGTHVVGVDHQTVDTIAPGDAKSLKFTFVSDKTGQVVAHYLRFDPDSSTDVKGQVNFTIGVGERGVPLSPDTLVLPAVVDNISSDVVDAAMRVLGQAWSVANAPAGSLPSTVIRTTKTGVIHKALALAEAGLRVNLGQAAGDALRDFALDFYGGTTLDNGFDQLLRTTEAGRAFALTLGGALGPVVLQAGGPNAWQRALAQLSASGPDLMTFTASTDGGAPLANVTMSDASGGQASAATDDQAPTPGDSDIRSAAMLSLGNPGAAPIAGIITAPTATPYTLNLTGTSSAGAVDLTVSLPQGDGSVIRGTLAGTAIPTGAHARVVLDPSRASALTLDLDADGDGTFESSVPFGVETLMPQGPTALAAVVVGPETVDGAQPFGFNLAVLFDRTVDATAASNASNYTIPSNTVVSPHRQLSGRLVFTSLSRPEGPYVPTTMTIANVTDARGAMGPTTTVPVTSRLLDPGAVIRGRVMNADGSPVSTGVVTYLAKKDPTDCQDTEIDGYSAIALGADGRFEFRYVRQDTMCGYPWYMSANDPNTGALRQVIGIVRGPGEQIEADIVLFGRGNISGLVKDLVGHPVAGAKVVALSMTDPQSFGQATTDGDGRYTIYGLTVGAVNVSSVKGISGGRATGNIGRAGDTGTANVTLDGGTVSVSGVVRRVDGPAATPLPGALVIYYVNDQSGSTPVAVTTTGADGSYSIGELPVGAFLIQARVDSRAVGSVTGVAAAGDALTEDVAIVLEDGATVHGHVVLPDNSPAADTIVTINSSGVLTAPDGTFAIPHVPFRPFAQTVTARSRDGRRTGTASVTVIDAAHPPPDVLVAMSGLGSVDLLVVDPTGAPLANQLVTIIVPCSRSCGCALRVGTTNESGHIRFDDLAVGPVTANAQRLVHGIGDEAQQVFSIPRDGVVTFGVLRFPGFGTVTGTVIGPDGLPTEGVDVALQSESITPSSCGLQYGPSQTVRTDTNGHFLFSSVNIGPVGVTATHPFFNTTVGASNTLTAAGQNVDFALTLVNTIAGELSGTVYLPDGKTAVGTGVKVTVSGQLPDYTVSTDDQGHFQFAKIFPRGSYRITARDPVTGLLGFEDVYLNAGQDAVHPVRLKGQGTVRVHVVDGADQPVDVAYVTLRETAYPSRVFEAVLDASTGGVATFEHVFEGSFSVEVIDSFGRGARPSGTLPGPGQTIDIKARVTTTGTVRGHFYAADHVTPVPFGVIQLIEYWRYGVVGQLTAAGSGDVGSFEFTHVPAGQIRVRAQDPLTGRVGIGVGQLNDEGEVVTIDVFAQGIGSVHGLVTSNGAPQPGAHVTVVSGPYSAGTLTDSDGHYVVGGVPEGPVTATASLSTSGFLEGLTAATMIGDGIDLAMDVALHDSGAIDGTLVAADGTTPGPISIVTAQSGGFGGGTQTVTTDPSGAFHFDRAPSGLATLTADVLSSIDQGSVTVTVPDAGTAQVTLQLNGIGSIDGAARDAAGNPVAGLISITGTGTARYSQTATASVDGVFHLPEVLAGPFTASLRATVNGLTLYGSANGVVTPDQPTLLTLVLQDSGTITGHVLRPDGVTPAIGAAVTIQLDHSRGSLDVQTQADGSFSVSGVPLGGFNASVFDAGSAGVGRTILRQLAQNGDIADVGTIVVDNRPFTILSIDPTDGSAGVPPATTATIALSAPVESLAGLHVLNAAGSWLGYFAQISTDGLGVTITNGFPDGQDVTIELDSVFRDVYSRHLLQPVRSRFHTIDTTPPHVVSLTPADGSIQVPGTTPIVAMFSEPISAVSTNMATVIAVTDGSGAAIAGTSVLTSPTVITFTAAVPLPDEGYYHALVSGAYDLTGNRETSNAQAFFATPDTTPPVINSPQPANGAVVNSATPRLSLSWTDSGSGVKWATTGALTVDGHVVNAISGYYGLYWDPSPPLSEGVHTFSASVLDNAGNRGTSATTSFTVDSQPPTVPVISGLVDNQVVSGVITISASSTDGGTGVARIDLFDGSQFYTLPALFPPNFSAQVDTRSLPDGIYLVQARATDGVSNHSDLTAPIHMLVDNHPLTVAAITPAQNSRFRDTVTVTVVTSELADHVNMSVGTVTLPATGPGNNSYSATLPLATAQEGSVVITISITDQVGQVVTATRTIVVDRTPPAPPDGSKINAAPPADGLSTVSGSLGAVEASATVRVTNVASAATASVAAAADGSFSLTVAANADDLVSITATDDVGNQSAATLVAVRRTVALPPPAVNTSLTYLGTLVDRVGAASGAITPDGTADAVFTLSLSIGNNVTRVLSYIDLVGPLTRSTRVNAGGALGVAVDQTSPLLNNANGTVGFPITTGTTLTLFASAAGFIQNGATYTATAAFTDGTTFVGTFTIVPPERTPGVMRSAQLTATASTITGNAASPGTAVVTISNIRDIQGTRVVDGQKIAVAVANGASTDPRGTALTSAGGSLLDGTVAANNANFRVYPILNGVVAATYSTGAINPAAVTGTQVIVQLLPADSANNVLGTEAAATLDLSVRAPADRAVVTATPTQLYGDKTDRRAHIVVRMRDAAGNPMPDGSRFAITPVGGGSAGGSIIGGVATVNGGTFARAFSTTGGQFECDYSTTGSSFARPTVGNVSFVVFQVWPVDANNNVTSFTSLGSVNIPITSGAAADFDTSGPSVAATYPLPVFPFTVRHVKDIRGNLVPDGAQFVLTASYANLPYKGVGVQSIGGTIAGGTLGSGGYRVYTLASGQISTSYSTNTTYVPASVQTATIQMGMGDVPNGFYDFNLVAIKPVIVTAPTQALPAPPALTMLGDGLVHQANVTFAPIIDSYGNVLPDGSHIVVGPGTGYGQILGGTASNNGTSSRVFPVQNGAVTVTYSESRPISPNAPLSENINLYEANTSDGIGSFTVLGAATVTLIDSTSTQLTASITSPANNSRFRDSVPVTVLTTGTVDHVVVSAGSTSVTATGSGHNFTATLPLAAVAEGSAMVWATAFSPTGTSNSSAITIVVDRTPPTAPDGTRITAGYPPAGVSQVTAVAGAVEATSIVTTTNTANDAVVVTPAGADGSFALTISAHPDDVLSITATDAVGNTSAPSFVNVPHSSSPLTAVNSVIDPSNPLASGLAGLFLMNEGSGTTDRNLVDAQTATLSGTVLPVWNTTDPSLVFAGGGFTNSYLNAGSDLIFDQLTPGKMSVIARVYLNGVTQGGFAEKNDSGSGGAGFAFGMDATGALKFSVERFNTWMRVATGASSITAGHWAQVAVTWDGTVGLASAAHIYVDGVELTKTSSTDGSGAINYTAATNQPFRIGAAGIDFAGSLNGKMSYLAVYKGRVLTPAELQAFDAQPPTTLNDLVGLVQPNAPAATVTPAIAGQRVQLSFTAAIGQTATAHITGNTLGTVAVSLLRPDRSIAGTITTSASSFDVPATMVTSTAPYYIYIVPGPSASGSIGVAVTMTDIPSRPAGAVFDPSNPLAASLAGLFLMNEAAGTTTRNVVDSQNAALAGAAPPTWNATDPSLVFKGGGSLNSYADAGTDLAFDHMPTDRFTIAAKIFVTTLANAGIVEKHDNNTIDSGFVFGYDSVGALHLTVEKNITNMRVNTAGGAIVTGRWMQVAVTWDGTVGNSTAAHLFVNGVEVPKTTNADGSGTIGFANATNKPLRIGNAFFDFIGSLNGRMAYVAIYRGRILSTAELAALDGQLPIH